MSDFFEEYYILRNKIYDALDTIYNTNLNDECLLEYKKEEVNSLFFKNLFLCCIDFYSMDFKYRRLVKSLLKEMHFYHYTNYYALESILDSKTLYFTKLGEMNENQEGKILIQRVKEDLLKKYTSQADSYIINEGIMKSIFYLENMYSFSLSAVYDDAPLWERYGGSELGKHKKLSGQGVCIEFSFSDFL